MFWRISAALILSCFVVGCGRGAGSGAGAANGTELTLYVDGMTERQGLT